MKMFTPFAYARPDGAEEEGAAAAPAAASAAVASGSDESLAQMKSQIDAMQKQIEKLISSKD